MVTIFRNLRWRQPPSWILINVRFWHFNCILCRIRHIQVKFGKDWSNNKEMATVFRNLRWRPPPSWILVSWRFWRESRILYQIRHIPVKFGDDWMNNKEMATVFLHSRWRHFEFSLICIPDKMVTFYIGFSTCPSNLLRIWQQFVYIQDGGRCHFEF